MGKKYKMLRPEWIGNRFREGELVKVSRIQALRDIPLHGVKKGDLGGWIGADKQTTLAQDDECWIGRNAIVLGSVGIVGNVLVSGNALIHGGARVKRIGADGYYFGLSVEGNAKILEDARIDYSSGTGIEGEGGFIGKYAVIKGKATLQGVRSVGDRTIIEGNVSIDFGCSFEGDTIVKDNVRVGKLAHIGAWAEISDNAQIGDHSKILGGTKIGGTSVIPPYSHIQDGKLVKTADAPVRKQVEYVAGEQAAFPAIDNSQPTQEAWDAYVHKYKDIKGKIAGYSTDIVNILKYPVMTDLTNVHTAEMTFVLKKADLEIGLRNHATFFAAVENLEMKYLVAESNARKVAASLLSDSDRKKTEQARDLFALACNEASPEPEKRNAFKQGFRKLEGVVAVPEEAIQAMRIRVGIPELEM